MSVWMFIRCDRCRKSAKVGWPTAREARSNLRSTGWRHPERGADLCPDCAAIVAAEAKATTGNGYF